ncbi:HMA2 domain-containing protein [Anaeromicrobium sediminis]|uniref:HMA domain-containing protein n=1 Tax=Anaeromicrobium sediminis TaxID=1478221 RepID=A0A267MLA1_9FIRM|nr:hypothetical protein [Anaeromicrobium sediminis]PAB60384.1 hypothetical protein CCE28_05675 [Anaeromicrobium sediminis]
MVYFAEINFKIISSIPGRVRVNIDSLLKKEKTGHLIINSLKSINGIISASFNKRTRNILIFYRWEEIDESQLLNKIKDLDYKKTHNNISKSINKDSIGKIILQTLNPFSLIKKKYPNKGYKDDYSLSKKIIKLGLLLGGIVFAITSNLRNLISILILSYPGILFAISSIAYFYSAKKAHFNDIYLKKDYFIGLLGKTDTLFIEDNLLIKEKYISNTLLNNLNTTTIRRFAALKKLDNPIDPELEKIIYKIREYGITNLILFSDNNKELLDYISYSLGIDKTYFLKDNILILKDLKTEENVTAIIVKDSIEKIRNLNMDLVVCINLTDKGNILIGDINFIDKKMNKFPWLLNLSKYNEEVITRSQALAIGLNTLGIFLCMITNINPFFALGIYGLNILTQTIRIKYSVETI